MNTIAQKVRIKKAIRLLAANAAVLAHVANQLNKIADPSLINELRVLRSRTASIAQSLQKHPALAPQERIQEEKKSNILKPAEPVEPKNKEKDTLKGLWIPNSAENNK